ncbi:GIY-YIG nuclease family protein [Bradyrhizobium sp. 173]|uniref:GIY-YIG nuclease family protein n=1 Tax=Bradyrhizobium sp. 173 TaxID=2782644 RepID=UPI001FFB76AD|nr:GIY-YIG nuclease family protein [Bradyrhizobium sp. 173]MCK1568967.1 GIY-YIG nuclease family protein [Bradyrhizobium sp. 173]
MSVTLKSDGHVVDVEMPSIGRSDRRRMLVARKPRDLRRGSKIYFILCQATGRVKCGVANDPRARLMGLQVGSPTPLKLIAEIDGDDAKEKLIHRRLDRWHIHGEWFHYVPEVCDIIVDEISSFFKELYLGETIVGIFAADGTAKPTRATDPRIHRFVADCIDSCPGARTQSSKLYQAFAAWCGSLGMIGCSQKAFTMAMANAGYRRITSNVVFFVDIKLKAPPSGD